MARDFTTKGGITFTMLWDESFQSWVELGIRSQPAAILYAGDGTELSRWQGRIDEDELLELIGS
ncbi:MAG: hypothetical protein IT196_13385 [Acidimicrobiales bacterium]|nr:hypothetical protein [Acidimicrobiales bacterium]